MIFFFLFELGFEEGHGVFGVQGALKGGTFGVCVSLIFGKERNDSTLFRSYVRFSRIIMHTNFVISRC